MSPTFEDEERYKPNAQHAIRRLTYLIESSASDV